MTCLRRLSSPRPPCLGKENIVSLFWLKFSSEIPPKKSRGTFQKFFRKKTHAHTNGAQTLLLLLLLRLTERERLRVLLFFIERKSCKRVYTHKRERKEKYNNNGFFRCCIHDAIHRRAKNEIFSIIFAKKNDEIEELTGCQRGTANWE
jgi:hypothetical protein